MERKVIIKAFSPSRSMSFYVTKRKNFKIESELESGDGTLSLSVPSNTYLLACEGYLRAEGQEYVIKEISPARAGFRDVGAILNLEGLEGKLYRTYEKKATAAEHLTEAVKDTGWSVRCADGGSGSRSCCRGCWRAWSGRRPSCHPQRGRCRWT